MAKLQDILSVERNRPDAQSKQIIHLFLEGSFLRAYEWSAWLCHCYLNDFKPTRRQIKNADDEIVFIGFPQTSLEKYATDGIEVHADADKNVDLILPDSVIKDELSDVNFTNWKQSVPLAESKKKDSLQFMLPGISERNAQPSGLTGIMRSIMEFPLEQRTPFECMTFLACLKQDISKLL